MPRKPDTLNLFILAKKEESERAVLTEHKMLSMKLKKTKCELALAKSKFDAAQEQSTTINHKLASLMCQLALNKRRTNELRNEIIETDRKIEEHKDQLTRVNVVFNKESTTFDRKQQMIKKLKGEFIDFWKKEEVDSSIENLEKKKQELVEKINSLTLIVERNTNVMDVRYKELQTEILILQKRNAAIYKRLTKKVEFLEQRLREKHM